MTVEEFLAELCGICGRSMLTGQKARELVRTETERCLAVLQREADKATRCGDHTIAGYLNKCRHEILRSSPRREKDQAMTLDESISGGREDMTAAQELLRYLKLNASILILPPVELLVNKVIRSETERGVAMLRETANSEEVTSMCCSEDTGNLLDGLADEILRSSPGKNMENNAQRNSEATSPGERWEMEPYGQQHAFYEWLLSKLWPGIGTDEILQRLRTALYSESVRGANILLTKSHQMGIGETARNVLKECRAKMLGTSPSKGGG